MIELKYIGSQNRWQEISVTGKQSLWMVGQIEERSEIEAALLMATGFFSVEPVQVTAIANPVSAEVVKTIWVGNQAQYDAIATKDANTEYNIVS